MDRSSGGLGLVRRVVHRVIDGGERELSRSTLPAGAATAALERGAAARQRPAPRHTPRTRRANDPHVCGVSSTVALAGVASPRPRHQPARSARHRRTRPRPVAGSPDPATGRRRPRRDSREVAETQLQVWPHRARARRPGGDASRGHPTRRQRVVAVVRGGEVGVDRDGYAGSPRADAARVSASTRACRPDRLPRDHQLDIRAPASAAGRSGPTAVRPGGPPSASSHATTTITPPASTVPDSCGPVMSWCCSHVDTRCKVVLVLSPPSSGGP